GRRWAQEEICPQGSDRTRSRTSPVGSPRAHSQDKSAPVWCHMPRRTSLQCYYRADRPNISWCMYPTRVSHADRSGFFPHLSLCLACADQLDGAPMSPCLSQESLGTVSGHSSPACHQTSGQERDRVQRL